MRRPAGLFTCPWWFTLLVAFAVLASITMSPLTWWFAPRDAALSPLAPPAAGLFHKEEPRTDKRNIASPAVAQPSPAPAPPTPVSVLPPTDVAALPNDHTLKWTGQRRVLITGDTRSGSTWTGLFFKQWSDDAWYSFEPRVLPALLGPLLHCQLHLTENYPKVAKQAAVFWQDKAYPTLLARQERCERAPLVAIKFVESGWAQAGEEVEIIDEHYAAFPDDTLVIVLFRDPRALFSSEATLGWTQGRNTRETIKSICHRARRRLAVLRNQRQLRMLLLRYEDLLRDPRAIMQSVFEEELSLEFSEGTQQNAVVPHNRDDLEYKWQTSLPKADVKIIEQECADLMEVMGYATMSLFTSLDETDERAKEFVAPSSPNHGGDSEAAYIPTTRPFVPFCHHSLPASVRCLGHEKEQRPPPRESFNDDS